MDKILVLDFGGQYNQLIARRVRSEQVYAEIKPYNKITPKEIKETGYKGIIFTGGQFGFYTVFNVKRVQIFINIVNTMVFCYKVSGGLLTNTCNTRYVI